jgi:hypothetical protein
MDPSRPDETLRDFVERRERELMDQIQLLQDQLASKQRELADVREVKGKLGLPDAAPEMTPLPLSDNELIALIKTRGTACGALITLIQQRTPEQLTIKQMIMRTLLEHLKDGATPGELRNCIRENYARNIGDTSIRPNLERMKRNGLIQKESNGKWTPDHLIRQIFAAMTGDIMTWARANAWREGNTLNTMEAELRSAEEKLTNLTKDWN